MIVLETETRFLPQASVAVQVSVIVPPHAGGVVVKVEEAEVPLIWQLPVKPLLYVKVLAAGNSPQATVILAGGVMVGKAAGLTVILLLTGASALPQASVAVQVSVTVPPHAGGVVVKVEEAEVPLIKHPVDKPLLYDSVLAAGIPPQATVILAGGVMVGKAAGLTVNILVTGANCLPQASVAVQVSVIVPPQADGVGENVDRFDVPLIRHPPVKPLLNDNVLANGMAPQATVIGPGAVIVGNAAGRNVNDLVFTEIFPHKSVAVNVTVTVPPQALAVPVIAEVTLTGPSQLSVALAVAAQAVIAVASKHEIAGSDAGKVITGGVMSSIIIVWVTVLPVFPHSSNPVQYLIIFRSFVHPSCSSPRQALCNLTSPFTLVCFLE